MMNITSMRRSSWAVAFGRRYLGGIHGMTFGAEIVGAAIGPIPFELMRDLSGSYDTVIPGVTALPITAMIAMLLASPPARPPTPMTAP